MDNYLKQQRMASLLADLKGESHIITEIVEHAKKTEESKQAEKSIVALTGLLNQHLTSDIKEKAHTKLGQLINKL